MGGKVEKYLYLQLMEFSFRLTYFEMLQKPVIEKPNTTLRVGELRFKMLEDPEKLTL